MDGGGVIRKALVAAALAAAALSLTAASDVVVVTAHKGDKFMGVGSCAGSTCHGRTEPTGAVVRQDEIRVWQDLSSPTGAHLQAYRVLFEPRSQQIAAKLGIGPAQNARECLGCHGLVPANRGPRFSVSDGISCEACHGAAERWLASHYAVKGSHADNVRNGLLPLENPRVRAENCLDCHFGAKGDQFVTHRIMAAGHPRVSFELDLFSALSRHWNVDADYRERKQNVPGVKMWAVGQAAAVSRQLALYADPAKGTEGQFPEFYFFDCRSCHRPIYDEREWKPSRVANPFRPVAPGTPVFNDENLLMLSAAARIAAPDVAARYDADARAFHAAIMGDRAGAVRAAAKLRASAEGLADAFGRATFSRAETFAMLRAVLAEADSRRLSDYQGSAQAVMAADTLVNALQAEGQVPAGTRDSLKPAFNRAYAAVKDPQRFDTAEVKASLDALSAATARLQ
ncbi:MAG: multiheme c-type cytochrome [Sphingomonadaceae bacterium]|nr:multiheme c-type cytochrome [Sphingomonadaceae bacterium]